MEEESLSRNQIIIGCIVVVVIAGLGLWYFNARPQQSIVHPVSSATSSTIVSSTTMVVNTPQGSYTITQVPSADVPPPPQIRKPLVFTGAFSEEQKAAIEASAKALEDKLLKNPQDGAAWISLGTVRKIVGDYDGAKVAWEYVAKVFPKNAVPLYNLADLYGSFLKQYDKAEVYYLKVITIEPHDTNAYHNLFDLYSTVYKKDTSAAEDIMKKGITANPDAIDLHVVLARYYVSAGKAAEAKEQYDAAIASAKAQGRNDIVLQITQESIK